MAWQWHREKRGDGSASEADAAPPSLLRWASACGAIYFEGTGGVSVTAAAFLEGVEPRIEAVDAGAAAVEALRDGAALPLIEPLPGVAGVGIARGTEVEEMTDRRRRARTAGQIRGSAVGSSACRC
jgi:hypothetical protein